MKKCLLLLSLIPLAGCVTPKTLTRNEYLATTNREYPNRTPEQVIRAAEVILKLADGDDFKIAHTPGGFTATRNWVMYLVLSVAAGTDTWVVNTQASAGGTKINVQVSDQESSMIPMATGNGGTSITSLPSIGNPVQGTAIYDVFFARLEYLLGLRPDWMTCKAADERVSQKITWGENEALCNDFNMKDRTPTRPLYR